MGRLQSWVTWRTQVHNMPNWWQELAVVPGIDNPHKLAWEVWVSFKVPWWISEQHSVENYYQGPTSTTVHLLEELPSTA